jgi:hypothetical protein
MQRLARAAGSLASIGLARENRGVLVNLLPGLRELRGPLAAGYVVLGVLWASFVSEIPTDESSGLSGTLHDLKAFAGAVVLGAVVTFASYVVGSIATDAARILYASASAVSRRKGWDKPLSDGGILLYSEFRPLEFAYRGRRTLQQLVRRAWEDAESSKDKDTAIAAARIAFGTPSIASQNIAERLAGRDVKRIMGGPERVVEVELQHQTAEELDLVMIRLLGREPELFAAVDRLRGEHDMRLALTFSCTVLTVYFGFAGPSWACVASVLIVPLLAAQAIARRRAAGDQLIDALSIRRVQAPTLERFLELCDVVWAEPVGLPAPSPREQAESQTA